MGKDLYTLHNCLKYAILLKASTYSATIVIRLISKNIYFSNWGSYLKLNQLLLYIPVIFDTFSAEKIKFGQVGSNLTRC